MDTPSKARAFSWTHEQSVLELLRDAVETEGIDIVCVLGMRAEVHHQILTNRRDDLSRHRMVAVLVFPVFGGYVVLLADINELRLVHFELHELDLPQSFERENGSNTSFKATVVVSKEVKECLIGADMLELGLDKLGCVFAVRYTEKKI